MTLRPEWAFPRFWCAATLRSGDVKGDKQYRYIWEDRRMTVFRSPSYNSNGNTFDFEGRQVSCQDFLRRVVRWEHDGSLKVLADNFQGKALNSPNDLAPHPDGSIWFSDPSYGDSISEGHPDEAGGAMNPNGLYDANVGEGGTGVIGSTREVLPRNIYRWDPSGRLDLVLPEEPGLVPNGICFSPDYKLVYLVRGGALWVADVQGNKIANLRSFTDCMVDGVHCGPDGMHAVEAAACTPSCAVGERGALRPGRCSGPRRQYLGWFHVDPGLFRRDGMESRRQAFGAHSLAGGMSQYLFRRSQARLALHVRHAIDLSASREYPGRGTRLMGKLRTGSHRIAGASLAGWQVRASRRWRRPHLRASATSTASSARTSSISW